jgi:hypothetical protein
MVVGIMRKTRSDQNSQEMVMYVTSLPTYLQPERIVIVLAQAVMELPRTPEGAIMIDEPSPVLWHGMYLLTEASRRLGVPHPLDVPDWIALLATPLASWPLPLPLALQVDAALITSAGRPTPLAALLAAQAK